VEFWHEPAGTIRAAAPRLKREPPERRQRHENLKRS